MSSSLFHLDEEQLQRLREEKQRELREVEQEIRNRKKQAPAGAPGRPLTNDQIARYSRQLLLPDFGVSAQSALLRSSFLLVGCGGLGCPAAQYLASCGAGRLGLVDYDQVETSNLHRQVLHTEDGVGVNKAQSIKRAVLTLNSSVEVDTFAVSLDSSNALEIIKDFDVILDCTDNVSTRYLLNDACVLAGKPLVSGSALRFEGQLTVYNYKGGPTYRCLFPTPPPPETVTNCSDGGVVGAVPGVIGVLQALEAIKVASGAGEVASGRLLIFDGFTCKFRTVKLRGRVPESDKIEKLIDYNQFCGAGAHDKDEPLKLLDKSQRISVRDLEDKLKVHGDKVAVVDVRSAPEMDICSLAGSTNVPIGELDLERGAEKLKSLAEGKEEVVFLCRRGNDSQRAVNKAKKILDRRVKLADVAGGLHAWARDIDNDFPVY